MYFMSGVIRAAAATTLLTSLDRLNYLAQITDVRRHEWLVTGRLHEPNTGKWHRIPRNEPAAFFQPVRDGKDVQRPRCVDKYRHRRLAHHLQPGGRINVRLEL